jgi:GntR family transcriptional regulator
MNTSPKLASQLGISVGEALLFITRIGYNEAGRAVELTISYCRSDYYDFIAELRRE